MDAERTPLRKDNPAERAHRGNLNHLQQLCVVAFTKTMAALSSECLMAPAALGGQPVLHGCCTYPPITEQIPTGAVPIHPSQNGPPRVLYPSTHHRTDPHMQLVPLQVPSPSLHPSPQLLPCLPLPHRASCQAEVLLLCPPGQGYWSSPCSHLPGEEGQSDLPAPLGSDQPLCSPPHDKLPPPSTPS